MVKVCVIVMVAEFQLSLGNRGLYIDSLHPVTLLACALDLCFNYFGELKAQGESGDSCGVGRSVWVIWTQGSEVSFLVFRNTAATGSYVSLQVTGK
jgi:hypothetical protein